MIVRLRALEVERAGRVLFGGLQADLGPGLHAVVGDEGSGKSTMLAVLAGRLQPTRGVVEPAKRSVFFEDLTDPHLNAVTAEAWLADQRSRHPAWSSNEAQQMASELGLDPHLSKPLFQLSAGSRRKVGLVAAAASGATLTLLDSPFSALDGPSVRALVRCLERASVSTDRAWVVADYRPPVGLALRSVIDLDQA